MAEVGPDGYLKCVESVERDACDIMNGEQYSVNREFGQELYHILSRMEELRLDHDFLTNSEDLRRAHRYSLSQLNKRYEAMPILQAASDFLKEYKFKMTKEKLGVREANQIRELQEWAMLNVNKIEMMLDPYVTDAYNRTRTFSDHVGVTDRFTGFRQNLTKAAQQPFVYEPKWLRGKILPKTCHSVLFGHHPERLGNQLMLPPLSYDVKFLTEHGAPAVRPYEIAAEEEGGACKYGGPIEIINASVEKKTGILGTNLRIGGTLPPERINRGYLTIDSIYPGGTLEYEDDEPCKSLLMKLATDRRGDPKKPVEELNYYPYKQVTDLLEIQKSVGLNPQPKYNTEYKDHYKKPPIGIPRMNLVINPVPNLCMKGRPYLPEETNILTTEYQKRFCWPDKNNLYHLPWIKL